MEIAPDSLRDQLTQWVTNGNAAEALLDGANFSRGWLPNFGLGNAEQYWNAVFSGIAAGREIGGLERLRNAFRRSYPGNVLFQDDSGPRQPVSPREQVVAIRVRGITNTAAAYDAARRIHQDGRMAGTLEQAYYANGTLLLHLNEAPSEQGFALSRQLESDLRNGGYAHVQVACGIEGYRDHLLSRIFAEGPDQQQFEVRDVPVSTPVSDVARGVMSRYSETVAADAMGKPRPTVVDRVQPDGSTQRLTPDLSLYDCGIGEDATLAVHPESTAGMLHPAVRDAALIRVRNEMLEYARNHPDFQIEVHNTERPTEYRIRFQARSFAPPSEAGAPPEFRDDHTVRIILPPEFPMQAPAVYWDVPVFHPNIHLESGKVCLGALGDRYRPGLHFGDLCQTLIDMASYQNYAVDNGYNLEAQHWAVTEDGMRMIEARGGRCVLRKILDEQRAPRPLDIRRIDP